ncbi:MAG: universal stress protein [Bacteroidales bacterium]|nr:universal stress protein [Bacteroidales bacterium]
MEERFKNVILVPTDFSEACGNATNQAAEAAKFFNYGVKLLHIVDKNTKAYLKEENLTEDSLGTRLAAISSEIAEKYDIKAEYEIREGDIFTTISEVATDIGANILYLGTHGKVGIQKLTGSFALKVITSSPVPVIVVQKRKFNKGFSKIILPITSDAGPWEKTKWAALIAKQFEATIEIVQLEGEAIDVTVKTMVGRFEEEGIKHSVKKFAKSGNFSEKVINYATEIESDLIMIMTNPDSSWTSYLLGSYDEDIIFNSSQIPVMCINPRKFNWEKIVNY